MPPHPLDTFQAASFRKLLAACLGGLMLLVPAPAGAQTTASSYIFTHLAGPLGGPGSADGPAAEARFNSPYGLAVDRAGNVYVADTNNDTIRKITPAGLVTTLAGSPGQSGSADGTGADARFESPRNLAVDSTGLLYVISGHAIRKVTPAGVVTTLAGSASEMGNVDGSGSTARFAFPAGVTVDGAGNIFILDAANKVIRKIASDGSVTTPVSLPPPWGNPQGIAIDATGNFYITDPRYGTVSKISPTGVITTFAGMNDRGGTNDGTGTQARFWSPTGIAIDSAGNFYVADAYSYTIRKITPDGVVTTLAGLSLGGTTGVYGERGSTDGTGTAARFFYPNGVATDGNGNVYVADTGNNMIRKITPGGAVSTLASLAGGSGTTEGTGIVARFWNPGSVGVDRTGNVYVADTSNLTIRKITPVGVVNTFAGSTQSNGVADGTGAAAQFSHPAGVAVDNADNVYIADRWNTTLRKITPGAAVTTIAGDPGSLGSVDELSQLNFPFGVAVDGTGTIYWANRRNSTIRKITPDGTTTTLAGTFDVTGSADGTGTSAQFNFPRGVAVDSAGNVFVADTRNHTIRKITPAGMVTTLAGKAGIPDSTDGNGPDARFNLPASVAVDNAGNVFVADAGNQTLRMIAPNGTVTTVGGKAGVIGSSDGIGLDARFYDPAWISVDSAGNLYIADSGNHAIRKGQLRGPPVITTQPLSQTVAQGNSVLFSVTTAAIPAPTYQWFFNGSAISGATTNTLSFASARSADAGDYTVVVTNELGSVTSAKATLTISSAPAPSPSTPTPVPAGGGSIEGWFILAVMILSGTRIIRSNRLCP